MLGETVNLQCVCHITSADIPYHSNHSVSTEKNKNMLPSQALTAGRFQLALVVTWQVAATHTACYFKKKNNVLFLFKS